MEGHNLLQAEGTHQKRRISLKIHTIKTWFQDLHLISYIPIVWHSTGIGLEMTEEFSLSFNNSSLCRPLNREKGRNNNRENMSYLLDVVVNKSVQIMFRVILRGAICWIERDEETWQKFITLQTNSASRDDYLHLCYNIVTTQVIANGSSGSDSTKQQTKRVNSPDK